MVTGKVNQEQILHPKGTFWLFIARFDVSSTYLVLVLISILFLQKAGGLSLLVKLVRTKNISVIIPAIGTLQVSYLTTFHPALVTQPMLQR